MKERFFQNKLCTSKSKNCMKLCWSKKILETDLKFKEQGSNFSATKHLCSSLHWCVYKRNEKHQVSIQEWRYLATRSIQFCITLRFGGWLARKVFDSRFCHFLPLRLVLSSTDSFPYYPHFGQIELSAERARLHCFGDWVNLVFLTTLVGTHFIISFVVFFCADKARFLSLVSVETIFQIFCAHFQGLRPVCFRVLLSAVNDGVLNIFVIVNILMMTDFAHFSLFLASFENIHPTSALETFDGFPWKFRKRNELLFRNTCITSFWRISKQCMLGASRC